jgi:hypothetical protein
LSLLAGIGAMPRRWAKTAWECNRCGLSPAVVSSCPATSTPTPQRMSSFGAVLMTRALELGSGEDLLTQVLVSAV